MQRHTTRFIVAALLIAAGAIGGFFVFRAHQQVLAIDDAARDSAARIDRLIDTAAEIGAAQHAYVVPGQASDAWLERCATLLQQFGQDAAVARPPLASTEVAGILDEVDTRFAALVRLDGTVRQELQEGQSLLAADLIFSEGRDSVVAIIGSLRKLESAEQQTAQTRRTILEQQQGAVLAGIGVLWALGLVLLARPAWRSKPASTDSGSVNFSRLESTATDVRSPESALASTIDLAAAVNVCGALARTTDAESLRDALTRAAAVLDARGIIVWMGAGEELFPALAIGYDERVIERLGPIARNASNATADAWRTAELRTVAGDVMAYGAIAAPVHGTAGCVGVFAAEVRHGREADPATQAVAAIVAAQLAGLVAAWPSASAGVHKTA
jgi:hypothetical protein